MNDRLVEDYLRDEYYNFLSALEKVKIKLEIELKRIILPISNHLRSDHDTFQRFYIV
jgi:hypothetical protein